MYSVTFLNNYKVAELPHKTAVYLWLCSDKILGVHLVYVFLKGAEQDILFYFPQHL